MNIVKNILLKLENASEKEKQEIFPKFFKTGPGEYGHGDIFWGISIPNIRSVAKEYYREISLEEIKELVVSPIHEVRQAGYLILTYKFEKADFKEKEDIALFYLDNLEGVNNWDLVDLSCYKILGEYLLLKPESKKELYKLADSNSLWKERISIVSTYAFIKKGLFEDTLEISKKLLSHKHDLIHKAIGWMLREVGKKDISVLREFLNKNIKEMPRTSLRYAIERMEESERKKYLKM